MLNLALMASVARQMTASTEVSVGEKTAPVKRTSVQRLKAVRFRMHGREYEALEQNAAKPSRWGELARAGHQVVQFRDCVSGKYVGVAVDGKVQAYGR